MRAEREEVVPPKRDRAQKPLTEVIIQPYP
jgi:hypothetical protein